MTRFLITGGAGFIGSSLIDNLLMLGNSVVCIDNFDIFYDRKRKERNLSTALNNSNFSLIEGDIRDSNLLEKCFVKFEIDMVIHLAAKAGVRPSINFPEIYLDNNINGTVTLLEVMRRFSVNKLIFASSSSVYGNNSKTPFTEIDNVDYPISPYAASKKSCELLCHVYHHLYNFHIYCLRFFTVYGPRQRPDLAIYKFTDKIFHNRPITLYGNGNTLRDYTYIDDIIQGLMGAITNLSGYEIFNLGAANSISLGRLVEIIEKTIGLKATIIYEQEQEGDVVQTFADITKAKRMLNYNPTVSLEYGIRNFFEWYKSENSNHRFKTNSN